MRIYVINMEKDKDRKTYMTSILEKSEIQNYEFVSAVVGKELTNDEKKKSFNQKNFLKLNAKNPNDAQIGCCLSHRKCYEKFLNSEDSWCLIFEDDVAFFDDFKNSLDEIYEAIRNVEEPSIFLLSGFFWYYKHSKITNFKKVYSGFLTHAYLLNRNAAKRLLNGIPYYVADDWYFIRKKLGISIYGRVPHIVNQKWDDTFDSSTKSLKIVYEPGLFLSKLRILIKVTIQRVLKKAGFFEKAI